MVLLVLGERKRGRGDGDGRPRGDEEGWLRTGDLGTVDEQGYLRITGRIKDMIVRGGENIYPREIEEFLLGMAEVKDVQVLGIPSRRYGEEIAAFIHRYIVSNEK